MTNTAEAAIVTHWFFRWLKSSGICLAGEGCMRHICSQIVGDNLKGKIAPFSFPLPSRGEETLSRAAAQYCAVIYPALGRQRNFAQQLQ